METSSHLLLLFFFFFFPLAAFSGETCSPITCGLIGPPIRFPFWVPGRYTCGYKGFDLSCHHRRPILTLPDAGDFLVSRIDYQNQVLFINDPDFCLPKRLLNFSLAGSVFQKGPNWANVTFLNCSSEFPMEQFVPVLCLSGNHNYTTVVSTDGTHVPPSCRILGTVSAPTYDQYTFNMDLLESLPLTWKFPNCRSCEAGGGTCGLKSGKVSCSGLPRRGLPRSAKYGVIIGVGIPGLVCLMGLLCCACNRIKTYGHRRGRRHHHHHHEEFFMPAIIPQPGGAVAAGLNSSTIESYPKSVLGHSGRLPRPNDNTCSICLAEYQPKETLRTIPDCNHYFHAACVDEWLKMNATCPLCRNTPVESSVVTPRSSSISSSSANSSSS
ncbi:putative RING-H2 finger protein ATL21B isoform X1 [Diospyros lotus]|uniref:putative RING-H2 finger protein ATL21B isoform X1 n=1 Tax=Diospyros lotus TaxID=55363 RepID=UPI00224FFB06|nr:putative RING-H2 finger protein ATL21B isoform X1 [Diospyros lotus]